MLDCNKCIKKHSVSSTRGHCQEFSEMPQVESCAKMDMGPRSVTSVENELPSASSTGSYMWLRKHEENRPTLDI